MQARKLPLRHITREEATTRGLPGLVKFAGAIVHPITLPIPEEPTPEFTTEKTNHLPTVEEAENDVWFTDFNKGEEL